MNLVYIYIMEGIIYESNCRENVCDIAVDCRKQGGITLQEIANEMEMAKSSTYVIVQTLLELNYITTVQNNNKKYCLGIEAFLWE